MSTRAGMVAVALTAWVGCAAQHEGGVVAAEPHQVVHLTQAEVSGPYVPAGTEVTVRISEDLGTDLSRPGQPFTAIVQEPLVSPDGHVVVPDGAILRGHVARVVGGTRPLLALDFRTVQTPWGAAPIDAKVLGAQHVTLRGPVREGGPAYPATVSTFMWLPSSESLPEQTRDIQVPAGSVVHLQLTRPLVPRSSRP